jgi:hypothetical protein
MKAIFPNSQSLQPMPTPDVHANVSGNVNSTSNTVPVNGFTENTPASNGPAINVSTSTTSGGSNFIFYLIGLVIIIIVIIIYKKLKQNI